MILFVTPAIIPSYPCSSPAPRFLLVFIHFFMDCHRRWCLLWLQDRWRSCYWLDDLFSMLHIGDLIHYPQPYQLSHPLPIKSSFLHAVSCMLMRLGHTVNHQSNAKQLKSMELTINVSFYLTPSPIPSFLLISYYWISGLLDFFSSHFLSLIFVILFFLQLLLLIISKRFAPLFMEASVAFCKSCGTVNTSNNKNCWHFKNPQILLL